MWSPVSPLFEIQMSVNPWNEDVTCGIENHCKALFLSTWVHMEPGIDALVYNTFKTSLTVHLTCIFGLLT